MKTTRYTNAVLTVIAASLLWLCAQRLLSQPPAKAQAKLTNDSAGVTTAFLRTLLDSSDESTRAVAQMYLKRLGDGLLWGYVGWSPLTPQKKWFFCAPSDPSSGAERSYEALFEATYVRFLATGFPKEKLIQMGAGALLMGAFQDAFPCPKL